MGEMEEGGVLFFDLDRSDLNPTIYGTSVETDIGFDSEIGFQPLEGGAFVKYEFCLLDREVNPLMEALFNAPLNPAINVVTALHNHFLETNPKVKFLHGAVIGDPVAIAKILKNALSKNTGQPFEASQQGNTGLPNEKIADIIGGMQMISGNVLAVEVQRKETIRELGIVVRPSNHVHSLFSFQSLGTSQAACVAEFILLPSEVDTVARIMRANAFYVTAIHNHELFVEPHVYYLHAFNVGNPTTQAQTIRKALNHTNSKFES
jgi:hypothetical protein